MHQTSISTRLMAGLAALMLLLTHITGAQAQTLEAVRERGFLICAASNSLPGFSQRSAEGVWSGFDVDICRAIAAAVLGDPNLVQFQVLSGDSRFAVLQTGGIDVIARNASWTLARDARYGAHYVATSFFDGQTFLVRQDLNVVSAFELDDIRVCVTNTEDELSNMRDFFFANQALYHEVIYEDRADLAVAYEAGYCDAITAPASFLQSVRRKLPDPAKHRIMPELISKAPFGPTIRMGDDQWGDIVRWTLYALIDAEELGVSSQNIESMLSVRTPAIRRLLGVEQDFGTALGLDPAFMRNVIAAVGNYREIYERHFGPQTGAAMLRGPNALWSHGGLLYAPPIR